MIVALARVWPWAGGRVALGVVAGASAAVAIGVPTDLVDTPLFGRPVAVSVWAYPAWVAASVLVGLVVARSGRAGLATVGGGLLTVVAVGCPVCNKPVLLLLGESGAMQWFAPAQPLIAVLAVAVLAIPLTVAVLAAVIFIATGVVAGWLLWIVVAWWFFDPRHARLHARHRGPYRRSRSGWHHSRGPARGYWT